jgi:hypothetical protein
MDRYYRAAELGQDQTVRGKTGRALRLITANQLGELNGP